MHRRFDHRLTPSSRTIPNQDPTKKRPPPFQQDIPPTETTAEREQQKNKITNRSAAENKRLVLRRNVHGAPGRNISRDFVQSKLSEASGVRQRRRAILNHISSKAPALPDGGVSVAVVQISAVNHEFVVVRQHEPVGEILAHVVVGFLGLLDDLVLVIGD